MDYKGNYKYYSDYEKSDYCFRKSLAAKRAGDWVKWGE